MTNQHFDLIIVIRKANSKTSLSLTDLRCRCVTFKSWLKPWKADQDNAHLFSMNKYQHIIIEHNGIGEQALRSLCPDYPVVGCNVLWPWNNSDMLASVICCHQVLQTTAWSDSRNVINVASKGTGIKNNQESRPARGIVVKSKHGADTGNKDNVLPRWKILVFRGTARMTQQTLQFQSVLILEVKFLTAINLSILRRNSGDDRSRLVTALVGSRCAKPLATGQSWAKTSVSGMLFQIWTGVWEFSSR